MVKPVLSPADAPPACPFNNPARLRKRSLKDIYLAISHHAGFGPATANIFRGSTGRERSRKA